MAQAVDPKQPNEILDYDIECAREMSPGDRIASATGYITGPDDQIAIEKIGPVPYSSTVVKVWLADGTNLKKYKITLLILTEHGLLIEADFTIRIKDE